jgi:hypothetical protein
MIIIVTINLQMIVLMIKTWNWNLIKIIKFNFINYVFMIKTK